MHREENLAFRIFYPIGLIMSDYFDVLIILKGIAVEMSVKIHDTLVNLNFS